MTKVIRLGEAIFSTEGLELSREEKAFLHYALFLPGRKDSRPGLLAAARSDIPVLPDIIARCIKQRHRLEGNECETIKEHLESIVLAGLTRYEHVVFPADRLRHKNLVRGTAFISGVISEFCSRIDQQHLTDMGLGGSRCPNTRMWAYNLLVGDRQKAALKKASDYYAKAIILDLYPTDV